MTINWGMAGQNNNALAYFQMGQQLGQQVIDKRVNNAAARFMQGDQNAIADVAKYDAGLGMQLQERQARMQQQQQAEETRKRQTFRQLLKQAGENPGQAFAAAQQLGIPLDNVPQPGSPDFEPWRQTQLFIVDALETPEGQNLLTNRAKEVMLSLPPEHRNPQSPVFVQAMNKALQADALKTIPLVPGGGVAGVNTMDGTARLLIAPNPGTAQTGSPVAGGVQEGATATNPQTGAKIIFRNGQWQPMGGQPAGGVPFQQ